MKALSQLVIKIYITEKEKNGQAPSRCFISLELSNIFNKISRDICFEIIEQKYPKLLPLVSMLYGKEGTVFFKITDGLCHTQEMAEGVNQGCSLLATLATLVLGEVLHPLDMAMKARA